MNDYDNRVRIYRAQHDKDNPYFLMRRDTAQDASLSFEARGMLAYLLSKPSDWMLMVSDLMRAGQCGRDRVRRILRELLDKGYAVRTVQRGDDGRYSTVDYAVYESPQTEKPSTDNPALDNPPLQSNEENKVTDKRALTEKNVNGTHEMTPQNIAQNEASDNATPSKPKRVDEYYDAIATAWKITNAGIIVQLKGMLCGKGKVKGDWLTYKIDPPLTLDEVVAFAEYARRRMQKEFGKNELPSKPATIALWVDAWRQIRVKTDVQVSSQAQHEIEPFAGIYDAIDAAGAAGTRAAVTADQVRATMVGEGMRSAAKALATVFQTKGA